MRILFWELFNKVLTKFNVKALFKFISLKHILFVFMKYIGYVFYYARELLFLSFLLTLCYVFIPVFAPMAIAVKLVLPFVFFIIKKMNDQTTLYFLYNLGMRNRTILFLLFFLSNVDVFLLHFLIR